MKSIMDRVAEHYKKAFQYLEKFDIKIKSQEESKQNTFFPYFTL